MIPHSTKPLKRSPVRKKRKGGPRRVSVVRDREYMDWLKDQFCVACRTLNGPAFCALWESVGTRVLGLIDPAHTAPTNGARSKGPDSSCIPLCREHHDEMDGRLSTKITTKAQFAEKYGLDLAAIAAEHHARYMEEGNTGSVARVATLS